MMIYNIQYPRYHRQLDVRHSSDARTAGIRNLKKMSRIIESDHWMDVNWGSKNGNG